MKSEKNKVILFPESDAKRAERHALSLIREPVLCQCETCGDLVFSQVNRNGWGDACRACGRGDLRDVSRLNPGWEG